MEVDLLHSNATGPTESHLNVILHDSESSLLTIIKMDKQMKFHHFFPLLFEKTNLGRFLTISRKGAMPFKVHKF